jgi:hypothetical protein
MLFGVIGALIAWGVATLILKRGSSSATTALAVAAGLVVAIAISWVGTEMIVRGAIPVGGIAGAIVGVVAAVVAERRKAKST